MRAGAEVPGSPVCYHRHLFELTLSTAHEYVKEHCGTDAGAIGIRELGGGVSNTVLLVECGTKRFVLKQSLEKLRVEQEWLSDRTRIHRECAAMEALGPHLPPDSVPRILFEDQANCIFAMSAAPAHAETWKSLLLAGNIDTGIAAKIGQMLGCIIGESRKRPDWKARFSDQTVFDQLRLDPYYRATAQRHPGLALFFEHLIQKARTRRISLVHGDWSPKNFLVDGGSVMAIDFEVVHYGDPAFDAAFLTNHLVLKTFHRPYWRSAYRSAALAFRDAVMDTVRELPEEFEQDTIEHLAGLLLARIDGKSPAEYIQEEAAKARVRAFGLGLVADLPSSTEELFDRIPE